MRDIVEGLRDANIGWSGDASCVDADTAAEGAVEIERLRYRLEYMEAKYGKIDWDARTPGQPPS